MFPGLGGKDPTASARCINALLKTLAEEENPEERSRSLLKFAELIPEQFLKQLPIALVKCLPIDQVTALFYRMMELDESDQVGMKQFLTDMKQAAKLGEIPNEMEQELEARLDPLRG